MADKYEHIRPQAQVDFFKGMFLDDVANKYDVPRSTAQGWRDQIKDHLREPIEVRAQKFADKLEDAFVSLTDANRALLDLVQDKQWLLAKTAAAGGTHEVLTLIERLTINLIGLGRATGAVDGPQPAALPAHTDNGNFIQAEIVDE